MKENTVQVAYKESPVLLDRVLQELRQTLLSKLDWLDYAFGRAYKLVRPLDDGGKFVEPAIYNGNGEYLSMLPNDRFGNFCWFDIYDPQQIQAKLVGQPQMVFAGAIVFWYDLRTISQDQKFLYTEDVKNQIVTTLSSAGILKTDGSLRIFTIYENFENIYKGYTLAKVYNEYLYSGEDIQAYDKQYFMYPYAGLRVEFSLTASATVNTDCL